MPNVLTTDKHDIWARLDAQLAAQLVSVIMIDEFHHTLSTRSRDQQQLVVETIKLRTMLAQSNAADAASQPRRPVSFVLSGMPGMMEPIGRELQFRRRSLVMPIEALKYGKDQRKVEKFLSLVESKLPFSAESALSSPDMINRFMTASNGYLGRMMALIKLASYRAIRYNDSHLDPIKHFSVVFEEIFRVPRSRNPFLVGNISECPKLPEEEFEKLTLLRGIHVEDDEELYA